MDEDAFMQRVKNGDADAFRVIVSAHQARLVRVASRLLNDSEAGQDVAQEAFLRLWRLRDRYAPQGCLRGYLLRIVHTVCLDYQRASWHEVSFEDDAPEGAPSPEAVAQGRGLADAVAQAVQSLPEPQRAVFILSHYEGLSYAEIAAALDCPIGTVASRKHQATESLRRKLHTWGDKP